MLKWWPAASWLMNVFQGCYEKVEEWLDDNKHLLGTIAMCVLVIQVSVSSGGAQPEGLLQHWFISTPCVCVSSAPRDGLLHDSLPADPQVRKEVRSLRTKAATLLIRGTWYITVRPIRTAYSVTFSLFYYSQTKPVTFLKIQPFYPTSIKTACCRQVAFEVALLVVAFWNACFLL